jgi:membrane protease YdiL (CAAX protease family)
VLISFTAIFGFVQLTNLCVQLFGDWGLEIRNADELLEQAEYIRDNFWRAFIVSAILPPIYEEFVFRMGGVRLLRSTDIKSSGSIILTAVGFVSVFSLFLFTNGGILIVMLLAFAAYFAQPVPKTKALPDIYIVLITAAVFMIYHHSWSQTVYQFLLGVVFAVIYLKTKNIGYTILIHFINNAFVIVYTYYNGAGEDANYPVNYGTVITAVGLAFLAVCVLYNLIRELPNGKEK